MKDCPCNDCEKRSVEPNCHGYCGEYKDWRANVWAEKDALRVGSEAEGRNKERMAKVCKRYKTKRQVGQR